MKLRFTLEGHRRIVDLLAVADATVTVGELATRVAAAQHGASDGGLQTLKVLGPRPLVLPPDTTLADSPIHDGATFALAPTFAGASDPNGADSVRAVVSVVTGADEGRTFDITSSVVYVGRDPDCEVRLDDPLISRQHARLLVSDIVEIIDLGSANGISIAGNLVQRATLRAADVVELGETRLTVRLLRPEARLEEGYVAFNRSPRLAPRYPGRKFETPEAPSRPQRRRLPMIPLVAPILMGALLYAITHTYASLIFVALSPLMMIGNALESIIFGRRDYRSELEGYRADLSALSTEAAVAREDERGARLAETPSTEDLLRAARDFSPLLWTRRPEHDEFLALRLGLGTQLSRNTFEINRNRQAAHEVVAEAVSVAEAYATIDEVPVVERLPEVGGLGVAGPRDRALSVAGALVAQLATLHSPAEVVLAAFVSTTTRRDWDWLKWLPHTSSPNSPLGDLHLSASPGEATRLLEELEGVVAERGGEHESQLPAIVVLVDDPAGEWSRIVSLAERGGRAGLSFVFLAEATEHLPAVCRTYVETGPTPEASLAGFVRAGVAVEPLAAETATPQELTELGRVLCPVRDAGAALEDETDLPAVANLFGLIGQDVGSAPAAVIERWRESNSLFAGPFGSPPKPRAGTLRAVVGQGTADKLTLDLRADGPHALVGGTTGSGKSEFLQSWILSLAATHSPQRLTFLLVDYKGGSAFRACSDLPHTVGLVTDLTPHLVQRTLTSLEAELRYREELLAVKRAKDLVDLEKAGDVDTPPSLVIVVDEFAALVQEVPEFVDGVVNIGQRGRSLGLHLVLATQRPAGVIKGNLRANTNLRVALRVADESDSLDVIDSTIAARFDPDTPGRAVVKTGPGRLTSFQSAYVGGSTTDGSQSGQISLYELPFGRGAECAPPDDHEQTLGEPPLTDISRLVSTIKTAADEAELPEPRRPWLDILEPTYDLAPLLTKSDRELAFGYLDDPERQRQLPVSFNPDSDGNLVVYGTGGSGKSTLLRTLAVAASVTRRGGPCWIYGLDFGSRGLHMIEQLPHVGAVIDGDDHERVARLLRWVKETIDERAARYAAAGAGTLTQYRERAKKADEARILILLDGVAAFRQSYEIGDRSKWYDTLLAIAADGRAVGVHLGLSADRPASVPSALASAIQSRVALRMADEMEYSLLGLPADVLSAQSPPGRGLFEGREIQVAVLGGSNDLFAQAQAAGGLAESMRRADLAPAPGVARLPAEIPVDVLPKAVDGHPTLGMESDELAPLGFSPRGGFLVAGPPGSGRTSALIAIEYALRRWNAAVRTVFIGTSRSPLAGLTTWDATAVTPEAAADLAISFAAEISPSPNGRPVAIFVEGAADFINTVADLPLQGLLKTALDHGCLVVGEGETSSLAGSYPLQQLVKSHRTGIVLQPDQVDGATLFKTNFPRAGRAEFPPGRGLYVSRGKVQVVQLPQITTPTA